MAKKDAYGKEAERLFVNEQCGIAEIASRLRLGEKTVRLWKAEGNWDVKREQYLTSRRSFHEKLYEFGVLLMDSLTADLKAGNKIDPGRMYTFSKVAPNLIKVKDYEDAVAHKGAAGEKKAASPEEIMQTVERMLGIEKPASKV